MEQLSIEFDNRLLFDTQYLLGPWIAIDFYRMVTSGVKNERQKDYFDSNLLSLYSNYLYNDDELV